MISNDSTVSPPLASGKPALDMAIIIVNGCYNYRDRLWIELSIGNLIRHTSQLSQYRIFLWNHDRNNRKVSEYLSSLDQFVEVLDESNFNIEHWPGARKTSPTAEINRFAGGFHVHRCPLQILFEYVISKYSVECFFTFDTDSWPLRDTWEIPFIDRLRNDAKIVGIWRNELRDVIPPYIHPACLGIRTDTILDLGLRFDHEPAPPLEDTLSHFTSTVAEIAGENAIFGLERSNRNQYHNVFGGIYQDLVYHHHLGTRYRDGRSLKPRTYGWQERGESPDNNKFILDAITEMVFKDADDLCCDLAFGADSFRLKLVNHFLRNRPDDSTSDQLYREADKVHETDPLLAYYLLGLIGNRFVSDPGFWKLQAVTCYKLGHAWEAGAYERMAMET